MLLPKGEVIAEIEAQMRKLGGAYRDWCVGVAKDPRAPLFETHVIEDRHDGWLYREAFTPVSAREVKDHFVLECGSAEDPESCDGGRLVYAYRKLSPESRSSCDVQESDAALSGLLKVTHGEHAA